ncbi:hypothetical protein SDC9_208427 [bioreactor metagenome]|uniref:Uncharacterized protein n=1 Tax=bioreactor metagenome TaxID=1076179 RepID=A0A645JB92_9ZZZZ
MFIGLFFTLSPRLPGTLIIVGAAFFYSALTGFSAYSSWLIISLLFLTLLAEIGGRVARTYLTKGFKVPILFSTDTTAGNLAGIVASDALFGPLLGTVIWELIVGKTLLPRLDTVFRVLSRLALVALIRFGCGLIMVVLISKYILK